MLKFAVMAVAGLVMWGALWLVARFILTGLDWFGWVGGFAALGIVIAASAVADRWLDRVGGRPQGPRRL